MTLRQISLTYTGSNQPVIFTEDCIAGDGTSGNPITVLVHANGNIICTASGLAVSGITGSVTLPINLATDVSGSLPVSHLNGGIDATVATFWRGDGTWAAVSGGSGGVTDHGALTGLSDDDHTQYVLVNGSRSMTGTLDLVTGTSLTIGGTTILSNSGSTATLSNIDVLDATTETTIENAIDTLPNLTSAVSLSITESQISDLGAYITRVVIDSSCLYGSGISASPLGISLDPNGNIICGANGLAVSGLSSGGDVFKSGTPSNNQVGVWVSDGVIEGTNLLTFDDTTLNVVGDISVSGLVDGRDISADGTKLDFITVTQSVDLDTMETDVAANTAKVSNVTHTGDVLGSSVLTIASGVVGLTKLVDIATDSFIGRDTAGTGSPEVLDVTAARSILNISVFGASLIDDATAASGRETLNVDIAGTDNSTDVTLAGTPDYITIAGQVITRNFVNLQTDVSGNLPVTNLGGGVGAGGNTFWRGDGTWASISGGGGGNVSNTGTPANNQIAIWTDATTIEGDPGFTWTGSVFNILGSITVSGLVDGRDIGDDGTKLDFITVTQSVDLDTMETDVTNNNAKVTNATHTGDVKGATVLTIASGVVSLDKMADMATDSFIGRDTAGSGPPEILSASTARTILNVDVAGTDNSTDVTLAGSLDYITISGQTITRNAIDLTTDITGNLPVTNLGGGTGASATTFFRGDGVWVSGNIGDVTKVGTPVDNQLGIWTGNGTLEGDSNLTYDGTTLNISGNITVNGIVDGRDLSVDGAKLDNIEPLADVTDATNVEAAGAVMYSQVDIDIKSLSLPSGTTISEFGATLVEASGAPNARAILNVDVAGTDNSTDVTLGGSLDYITIVGQVITVNYVDLANDVSGSLPVTHLNNGVGASATTFWRGDGVWASGGGVTDHGALTGLSDDDHPQYLLVDGSRSMSGSLDLISGTSLAVSGITVISDNEGTTTLSNIDAIDSVTETTIESAIDTLPNLTSASSLLITESQISDLQSYLTQSGIVSSDAWITLNDGSVTAITPNHYKFKLGGATPVTTILSGYDGQSIVVQVGSAQSLVNGTGNLALHNSRSILTPPETFAVPLTWDEGPGYWIQTGRPKIYDNIITFSDGDATPAINETDTFLTANTSPTEITAFDSGTPGQRFSVRIGDVNTTILGNSGIVMGEGHWEAGTTGIMLFEYRAGESYEVSRSTGFLMENEVDPDIKTLSLPASTTISTFGASLIDDASASAARITLGVDPSGTDNSTPVTFAGTLDYITLAGQVITRNFIDLANDVSGVLPDVNISSSSVWNGKIANVIEDTSPQLGAPLRAGANTISFTAQSATGDGTTTIDWRNGNKFNFQFGAANETFTFTAPSGTANLLLKLRQDGVGSRTATWPGTVLWAGGAAPTLTIASSGIDIVTFYYDGSSYYGVGSLGFA